MANNPPIPSFLFEQGRAAARRADHVYEAVVGVVVDHADPEGLGRVCVVLPTLPSDTDQTHWATVRSLGAGEDRGWYFLPEVDDEVVVVFEHGDIHRPVILGALWNGTDVAPEEAVEKRVLHSRAGSRIEMDDDAGTLTISDGSGTATIVLSAEAVSIEALSGDVCLQAPSGDVDLVAKDITIKAGGSVFMHSKSGTTISGQSEVTLEGGGAAVTGGMVNLNGSVSPAQGTSSSEEAVPDPVAT